MNKSKNSLYNALTAMMLPIFNGLLGIIVTRFIIHSFGSDFNGLNSTANQIVNVLLIVEGGFTLATNVALFQPINENDYHHISDILATTREKFKKIGIVFLVIGLIVSVVYSFLINSVLDKKIIIYTVFMSILPQAFNLYFITKYRVLLLAKQQEYIVNLSTLITISAGHIINILLMLKFSNIYLLRLVTVVFAILNGLIIMKFTKKTNHLISFRGKDKNIEIKGTSDVFQQKVTGMIYTSFPIVYLTISSTGGTETASVYAVYNYVFIMIRSVLNGLMGAPRLAFGSLLVENSKEKVWTLFKQYEYIAILAIYVVMTSSAILILPFINLYTRGFSDINYYDELLAIMLVIITITELLHIPSGHLINMAGEFEVSKKFQFIACIPLIILMIALGHFFGVYGILYAVLITAFILAVLEIGYVHKYFFKNKLSEFFNLMVPFMVVGFVIYYVVSPYVININSYAVFFVMGIILVVITAMTGLLITYFINKEFFSLINRMLDRIVKKR